MTTSIKEIRQNLKKKGFHVEPLADAAGPLTSTYHDPKTGQEFYRLPIDPWSLERYMKVHGWNPGPAPEELKAKWEELQANLKDPLEAYKVEGAKIVQDHAEKVRETVGSDMLELLQKMSDKINALEAKLNGDDGPEIEDNYPEPEPEPIEPTQLAFDLN